VVSRDFGDEFYHGLCSASAAIQSAGSSMSMVWRGMM
jgi:hypothetical protein